MDEQTTFSNVSGMSAATAPVQHQVMTEKWLLVLLIVGCTSLVFLICFPIDFYLYRRRKRLARERKNLSLPWYRPQTPSRAAQVHATLTVTKVAAEIDFEEMNDKDRKAYRAQRGILRFLSKIKRKSNRQKFQDSLGDSKSENSSDCRILNSPETTQTFTSTEYKSKGLFRDHNDLNSNTHVQDCDFMSREGKLSFETYNSHERELEQASAWKFPDAITWGENDELVDREMKQLNYGAFEPLENMTSFTTESNEANCFTVPVRGRSVMHIKPENVLSENYTGFKNSYTNGYHQDIIVESKYKTDFQKSEMNTGQGNTDNDNNGLDSEGGLENVDCRMISASQEIISVDENSETRLNGSLVHSNSDQCVSYNSKQTNLPFKTRRKGNAVSPTDKDLTSASDPDCINQKENSSKSNQRTFSPSATFEERSTSSNINRKKKKCAFLKKPSDSMPELQLYQKEKF